MAISPNTYCTFCGIHLSNNHSEYSTSPVTRKRRWFEEARAAAVDASSSPVVYLSGIGILLFRHTLSAPLNSQRSYTDSNPLQGIRLFQPTSTWWGYGFHDSCWTLFRARLSHVQSTTDILASVFDQFQTTACPHLSTLDFGHDYDGAGETHKAYGAAVPIEPDSSFLADPCAIPTVGEIEDSVTERPAGEYPRPADTTRQTAPNASWHLSLGKLPLELLYEVLSYLTFSQLLTARYVCQDLARLSLPDSLPESFWKRQFMLGFEQDFLFVDVSVRRNWSRLFRGTRFLMEDPSMVNRKRIRKLFEPIALMVELEVQTAKRATGTCVVMDHDSRAWRSTHDVALRDDIPALRDTTLLSGRIAADFARSQPGYRLEQHRAAAFPSHAPGSACRFEISTVCLGFRQYISGIKYIGADSWERTSQIGIYAGFKAESIEIPGPTSVRKFEVAFRPEGLVGIKIHFTDSDSSWVGQHNADEIAHAFIPVPEMAAHFYLIAGLDKYKVVALGLTLPENESIDNGSVYPPNNHTTNPMQCVLWIPKVPTHSTLAVSPVEPVQPPQPFEPLVDIDFGGPGGALLDTLVGIVVHMVSDTSPVTGMDFIYSDQSISFGRTGGTEKFFLIDGSSGERIDQVAITIDEAAGDKGSIMHGLQISTNYGRMMDFCTMRHQFSVSRRVLRPQTSDGYMITGFAAIAKRPIPNVAVLCQKPNHGSYFSRLGVQSQQLPVPSRIHRGKSNNEDIEGFLTRENQIQPGQASQFADCILGKSIGEYRTYARLTGLRRIQISTGLPGRSRSPSCISGLRLDYEGSIDTAFLGQWMNKYDSMELNENEQIQGLSFWLRIINPSPDRPGLQQGQVVAIEIATSQPRTVTFVAPDNQTPLCECMHHQYQSGAWGELRAIDWILNSSYDRVRAIRSRETNQSIIPVHASRVIPFNQLQDVMAEWTLEDGKRDMIAQIEGYFARDVICGLAFCYESGVKRVVGDIGTGTSSGQHRQQVIDLAGMRIIQFSTYVGENGLLQLEFHAIPQTHPDLVKLTLTSQPRLSTWKFVHQRMWFTSQETAGISTALKSSGDVHYPPPDNARWIGFYFPCQDFAEMGALFE